MKAPASAGLVLGSSMPWFRSDGRAFCVTNSEVVRTLSVSTGSTSGVTWFAPFDVGPWILGQAAGFSKWRFKRLRYFYIPTCPTSTTGSIHLGLQYDSLDTAPSTVQAISASYAYTTGPCWSGYQASSALSDFDTSIPEDAIAVEVDVTRFSLSWYPFTTLTAFTAQGTTLLSAQNSYAPGRLVFVTADGTSSTPIQIGRLYSQYEIEFIEPIAANLNT